MVDSAAEKLSQLNQGVKIEAMEETINEANISRLVAGFDLILDAMDNLPTRYLLNKAAIDKDIPLFHGAVHGFEGRAMTIIPGQTACLWCVYRGVTPPEEKFPVIGVTPAVIGCIQATEVIKYVVGIDPIWYAMCACLAIEIGCITPPVGVNVYAVKGVAGDDIGLGELFKGVIPYFFMMLAVQTTIIAFPVLSTFFASMVAL